jgi:hypothetical protein
MVVGSNPTGRSQSFIVCSYSVAVSTHKLTLSDLMLYDADPLCRHLRDVPEFFPAHMIKLHCADGERSLAVSAWLAF